MLYMVGRRGCVIIYLQNMDPKVQTVLYPGEPDHSQHWLVKEQMTGVGGMLAFELQGGVEAGKELMKTVKLCSLAENLGSVET